MPAPVKPLQADIDAYFLTTPRNAEWVAVTTPDIWLTEAYRLLIGLCYDETRDCCGRDFTEYWTAANGELALALSKAPTSIIGSGGGGASANQLVKRQRLGELEVEYQAPSDGTSALGRYGPNDPTVLQKFPWLSDYIGCWMTLTSTSGPRVIARTRS